METPIDGVHVDGNLVSAPAWPAHPQWLAAFLKVLGRKPNQEEQGRSVSLLQSGSGEETERRLSMLCHALLNLNEFVYIP